MSATSSIAYFFQFMDLELTVPRAKQTFPDNSPSFPAILSRLFNGDRSQQTKQEAAPLVGVGTRASR